MGIELIASVIILIALLFVATIDIAFSHVTDLGMRRITSEEESAGRKDSAQLLRDVIDTRPRFRFLLSSAIQILLIMFAVLVTVTLSLFVESRIYLLAIALGVGLVATDMLGFVGGDGVGDADVVQLDSLLFANGN